MSASMKTNVIDNSLSGVVFRAAQCVNNNPPIEPGDKPIQPGKEHQMNTHSTVQTDMEFSRQNGWNFHVGLNRAILRKRVAGKSWSIIASLIGLLLTSPFLLTAVAQGGLNASADKPFPPKPAAAYDATQQPSVSWPQRRYLCFSNTAILPLIQVLAADGIIRVGNLGTLHLDRLSKMSDQEAKIPAAELGVPTGLVMGVAKMASEEPGVSGAEVARQLRAAVIDFRFLLAELTCFHPSPNEQAAKEAVLLALLNGDLPSVWKFYCGLPWPQAPPPPQNLRITATQ
jgi:hypothetical protein